MLFRELNRSFQRYTAYWILMMLVVALSLILAHIMWRDVRYVHLKREIFMNDISDKTILYSAHEISPDDFARLSTPKLIEDLQNFRDAANDIQGVRMYDTISRWVKPVSGIPRLPDVLTDEVYYSRLPGEPEREEVSGPGETRPLNMTLVTANFMDEFGMRLSEGRIFGAESFTYDKDNPVEVVLGAAFREYFDIGDIFIVEYMLEMKVVVVGFLEAGSMYPGQGGNIEIVDHTIIGPIFDSVGSTGGFSRDDFILAMLTHAAAPNFIVEDPEVDVFEEINSIAARYDSLPLYIIPISYSDMDLVKSVSGQQAELSTILAILVFGVILITLIILISSKIRINLKVYSIYMLTGGSPWQVFWMMMSEIFIVFLCAIVLAVFLIRPIYAIGFNIRYLATQYVKYAAVLILVTGGIVRIQLRKLKLVELIRRNRT